jgi:hypothetical protein
MLLASSRAGTGDSTFLVVSQSSSRHLTPMTSVEIGDVQVPQLGQGTWNMAESTGKRPEEIAAPARRRRQAAEAGGRGNGITV